MPRTNAVRRSVLPSGRGQRLAPLVTLVPRSSVCCLLSALCFLPSAAWAQDLVGSSFKIDRQVVTGGGSAVGGASFSRTGASFASFDAFGQPGTGIVSGASFKAKEGYLYEFFNPPLAPSTLFANSVPPGAGGGQGSPIANMPTLSPVFSAVFGDPDAGDTGAKFRIQVSTDNTFASVTHWDSGAAGTAMPAVSSGARCADIAYGGSALAYGGVTYFWRVMFWDSTGESGAFSATAQFTTSAPLAVTTLSLPNCVVGTAYNQVLAASGGNGPYSWAVTAGAPPAGVSLSVAGALTGSPAGPAGPFTFSAQVTDSSVSPAQSAMRTLTIAVAPDLAITTASLPNGVTGSPYSQFVAATGGNPAIGFSLIAGALPAGLGLNAGTGEIAGVPAGPAGLASFTVRATDSTVPPGPDFFDQPHTIAISDDLVITSGSPLPAAVSGSPYSLLLASTGGNPPVTWSILSGALPAGLSLAPATGQITGTAVSLGSFSFTAQVMDSTAPTADTASAAFTLDVVPSALVIVTPTLPNGTVGVAYSATLVISGGVPPITGSVISGTIPPGLAINPATGNITGVPTSAGAFNFTVQVADSQATPATASQAYTVVINPAFSITTLALPFGVLGQSYASTVAVSGGQSPYAFTIPSGALPPGLSLNGTTGAVTGTPTALGTSAFTVQAADSTPITAAVSSRPYSIRVFALGQVINISAISANGQVDLSWDPVGGAASYKVFYGNITSGVYDGVDAVQGASPIAGAPLNSLTLTGLTNTKTYFIAVTAVNSGGNEGPLSAEITAKPLPSGQKTHTRVLAAGDRPEDFRMIGWPVLPSNQDPIANLSDNLGPYDSTQWRLFRWNPLTLQNEETPTTGAGSHKVEPGAAYWILVRNGGSIDVTGSLADGTRNFDVTLQPGWNMVGHPWDFPVLLSECLVDSVMFLDAANAKSRQDVWDYTGSYISISELVSGRGYWVKNLTASPITFSITPNPSPSAKAGRGKVSGPSGASFREAGEADDLPPPPPGAGQLIPTVAGLHHSGGGGGGGGGCFAAMGAYGSARGASWPLAAMGLALAVGLAAGRRRR